MTTDPTPPSPFELETQRIQKILREAKGIILERLEGEFQIVWTRYEEETGETRVEVMGYGNIHARLGAFERWAERVRQQMMDEDTESSIEFYLDDERGEPE